MIFSIVTYSDKISLYLFSASFANVVARSFSANAVSLDSRNALNKNGIKKSSNKLPNKNILITEKKKLERQLAVIMHT